MGGGVSSAIARSLGAGDAHQARPPGSARARDRRGNGLPRSRCCCSCSVPRRLRLLGGAGEASPTRCLFQRALRGAVTRLARQHVLERAARQRQHARAGARLIGAALPARAALGLDSCSGSGRCRSLASPAPALPTSHLRAGGDSRWSRASAIWRSPLRPASRGAALRGAPVSARSCASARHPRCSRAADGADRRHRHRLRRPLRHRGARRLRRGPAPGAAADPARLRRSARRSSCWSGPMSARPRGARQAHRLDRRRLAAALSAWRSARRGLLSLAWITSFQRRPGGARGRQPATCGSWRLSTCSSALNISLYFAAQGAGRVAAGRCLPAPRGWRSWSAGGSPWPLGVPLWGLFAVIALASR
jgi:hypothetical protein